MEVLSPSPLSFAKVVENMNNVPISMAPRGRRLNTSDSSGNQGVFDSDSRVRGRPTELNRVRIDPGKKYGDPQAQVDPEELRQYPSRRFYGASAPDRWNKPTTLYAMDPSRFEVPPASQVADHSRPAKLPNPLAAGIPVELLDRNFEVQQAMQDISTLSSNAKNLDRRLQNVALGSEKNSDYFRSQIIPVRDSEGWSQPVYVDTSINSLQRKQMLPGWATEQGNYPSQQQWSEMQRSQRRTPRSDVNQQRNIQQQNVQQQQQQNIDGADYKWYLGDPVL